MITFAWLAADEGNERFALWIKGDSKQRLTMHNDLPGELDELLPAPLKAWFDGIVDGIAGQLPNLRALAQHADTDWGPRLPGILQPVFTASSIAISAVTRTQGCSASTP
jgi:hypothetical protein